MIKKLGIYSSWGGFWLVYVNGLCVARVKKYEDIEKCEMNSEQREEWVRLSDKQKNKVKKMLKEKEISKKS